MAMPAEELRYTFADYIAWPEDERVELIYGEPYLLATPLRFHQEISGELYRQIANYLQGKRCRVYAAPFGVRLFEEKDDAPEDSDTVVEPDIAVVCDPEKLDRYGCKGAPDLVIEILSASTQKHDRFVKFKLYQLAGVREYWIVDPDSKTVQSFLLEGGRYAPCGFGEAGDQMPVGIYEDLSIDLSRVFAE